MVQFSQTKRFLDFSIGDTAIVTESLLLEEVMLTDEVTQFCVPVGEAFETFKKALNLKHCIFVPNFVKPTHHKAHL